MDQRNRPNPSVIESTDMSSLDTTENREGGGVEGRRERGSSGDRTREGDHDAEMMYLDEDEEAQLQEAIRLSMSEYERSQEQRLLPASSPYREDYLSSAAPGPAHFSYSSSPSVEQQQGSCRSMGCHHQEEDDRRRGAGAGGGRDCFSVLLNKRGRCSTASHPGLSTRHSR